MQVVLVLVGSKWFKRWRLVGRLILLVDFLSFIFFFFEPTILTAQILFVLGVLHVSKTTSRLVSAMRNKFGGRGLAALWRTRHKCLFLYKLKLWKHPIVNASLRIKSIVLQWFIHLQRNFYNKRWWSRLSKPGAPVITVDFYNYKVSSSYLLVNFYPLSFILHRIWNQFYAQNSDLVTWSWRSTLL